MEQTYFWRILRSLSLAFCLRVWQINSCLRLGFIQGDCIKAAWYFMVCVYSTESTESRAIFALNKSLFLFTLQSLLAQKYSKKAKIPKWPSICNTRVLCNICDVIALVHCPKENKSPSYVANPIFRLSLSLFLYAIPSFWHNIYWNTAPSRP